MKAFLAILIVFVTTVAYGLNCTPTSFVYSGQVSDLIVHVKVLRVYPNHEMEVVSLSNLSDGSIPKKFRIDYSGVAHWDGDKFPKGSEWLFRLNMPTKGSEKYIVPLCIPRLSVRNRIAKGAITEPHAEQKYNVDEIRTMIGTLNEKK